MGKIKDEIHIPIDDIGYITNNIDNDIDNSVLDFRLFILYILLTIFFTYNGIIIQ